MVDRLKLATDELERLSVLDGTMNKSAIDMASLVGDDVPFSMSLTIANYVMATFVGHFQVKLELGTDNLIPLNMICFILAKSGAKKTSSVIKMEKSLKGGYDDIDNYRKEKARTLAEETESDYFEPSPLSNAIATEAGMILRLNDFKKDGIGLPSLFVDEISTELSSNPDIIPNIKLVSQLFDIGEMKSKPLKDRKQQSDEVHGMGMNAMFIGSEHGILEDEAVLKKFQVEFISKLSRRSFFVYPVFVEEKETAKDIDSLLTELEIQDKNSDEKGNALSLLSEEISSRFIMEDVNHIGITDDALRLYKIYKIYCEELSRNIEIEAINLEQQHRHWKALKLAGVYSIYNKNEEITFQDLKEAINTAELTGADIGKFIEKANRETYEMMSDHFELNERPMSIHEMVKKKWIKKESDVKNLVLLANSKQADKGVFEVDENIVSYKRFEKPEGLNVSYMETENLEELMASGLSRREAKERMASKVFTGFKSVRTKFEHIGKLLQKDRAYSPFKFKDGKRGKDYIIGGADFIVLDVDDSDITEIEASDMLADYRHIIARGSDKDNPYKFRVILPTDIIVDLPNEKWKPFMRKVKQHLGIDIDLLPKSQIYFGYEGRELIINEEGEDLEASELVKNIDIPKEETKRITKSGGIEEAWDNRLNLFNFAYKVESGKGLHLALFGAMKEAHRLGFSIELNRELLEDIIDYIDDSPRAGFMSSLEDQRQVAYGLRK